MEYIVILALLIIGLFIVKKVVGCLFKAIAIAVLVAVFALIYYYFYY